MRKSNIIVLVFGLPGSGKSYFAYRFAQAISAEYCNSDRVRKEIFTESTYSESEKAKVYEVLLEKLEEAMDREKNFVLDATFHKNETRELFRTRGKGRISFIEIQADEGIIRERLRLDRPYSEADLDVYKLIKEQWEPMKESHLILQSTNDNIDAMLKQAVQYLKDDERTDQ